MALRREHVRLYSRKGSGSAPANAAPVWASDPVLTPTSVVVGDVVTTTDGVVTGYPAPSISYQFKRGGVTNVGTNSPSYTTVTADIGANNIKVTLTATNGSGSASRDSNSISVSAAPSGFVPSLRFNDARNSMYANF